MLRVDVQERRLVVATDHQGALGLLGAIPGGQVDRNNNGVYTYRRTLMMAERVREAALAARDQYGLAPTMSRGFGDLMSALRRFDAAEQYRDALDLPDGPTRTSLWPHQRQAFWWALERGGGSDVTLTGAPGGGSGLGLEMGTGKSLATVALLEGWATRLALIVCPLSVVGVWPREFRKHGGSPWSTWGGHAFGSTGKLLASPSVSQRAGAAERFIELAAVKHLPAALVVNYDIVWRPEMKALLLGLARAGRIDALVLDESQRAKAAGSKASQTCATLATYVDRVVLDSGTMMDESPLDLFGQFRAMDAGIFGTNWTSFRAENAITAPTPNGGKGVMVVGTRSDRLDYLSGQFRRHVIVKRAVDVFVGALKLPQALPPQERTFTLSAKARRIYEQLDATMTAEIGDGRATVNNVMVKILRLQQITSGHIPVARPCPTCQPQDIPWTATIESALDEAIAESQERIDAAEPVRAGEGDVWLDGMDLDRAREILGDRRTEAARRCPDCGGRGLKVAVDVVDDGRARLLADTLSLEVPDLEEPVVVHCVFRHDLDVIQQVSKAQGRVYAELSGRRRDGLNVDSEMVAGVGVLGCQIQSGGVGIDLTRAAIGIYHSMTPRLGVYDQSKARRNRPGQTRAPRDIHLVAENTVERLVYLALARKRNVVETVQQMAAAAGGRIDYDALDDLP